MAHLKFVKLKNGIKVARYVEAPSKPKTKAKKPRKRRPILKHSLLDELAARASAPQEVDTQRALQLLKQYCRAAKEAERVMRKRDRLAEQFVLAWGKGVIWDWDRAFMPALKADGRIEIREIAGKNSPAGR